MIYCCLASVPSEYECPWHLKKTQMEIALPHSVNIKMPKAVLNQNKFIA